MKIIPNHKLSIFTFIVSFGLEFNISKEIETLQNFVRLEFGNEYLTRLVISNKEF